MNLDPAARRAAKRVGLSAKKSRCRHAGANNRGEFMLIDLFRNRIVAGERFDLTADDVIDFCREQSSDQS
jgi:hypothetical protein